MRFRPDSGAGPTVAEIHALRRDPAEILKQLRVEGAVQAGIMDPIKVVAPQPGLAGAGRA